MRLGSATAQRRSAEARLVWATSEPAQGWADPNCETPRKSQRVAPCRPSWLLCRFSATCGSWDSARFLLSLFGGVLGACRSYSRASKAVSPARPGPAVPGFFLPLRSAEGPCHVLVASL